VVQKLGHWSPLENRVPINAEVLLQLFHLSDVCSYMKDHNTDYVPTLPFQMLSTYFLNRNLTQVILFLLNNLPIFSLLI